MTSILALDGDIICYRLGFAGQVGRVYAMEDETTYRGHFKNKTQAKKHIEDKGNIDYVEYFIPDTLNSVLHSVDVFIKDKLKRSKCDKHCIFLDGPRNFRNEIATILPYKGNRTQGKPIYYHVIRNHIMQKHPTRVIKNMEADDAISIMQYKGFKEGRRIVGATIDKDGKNTPGWLFNWDKMDEPEYITEVEANQSFYSQVLIGDKVDNYRGCRGVGEGGAAVKKIKTLDCEKEMWNIVLKEYEKAEEKATKHREEGKGKYRDDRPHNPYEEALENARLAWMYRTPPKFDEHGGILDECLWQPPGGV